MKNKIKALLVVSAFILNMLCISVNAESTNIKVDLSSLYNRSAFSGNDLWPGHHIDINKFKAENTQWKWKEAWTNEKVDNTLIFNGHEYYMNNIADGMKTFFRNHDNGNKEVYNINLEDGYYNEISFLASDYYTSSGNMKLAVRFNYKDTEPGNFVTKTLPKNATSATNGFSVSTITKSGIGTKYISEFVFDNVDSEKILESIDILPRDGEIDGNGALVAATGKSKLYETTIFGISAKGTIPQPVIPDEEEKGETEDNTPADEQIPVHIDISNRYNRKGFTGYDLMANLQIILDRFKAGGTDWTWKDEWTEGKTDNILVFNEKEYYMKNIYEDATVFFRNKDNGNSSVYNVDVEDGYYNDVSFLASTYYDYADSKIAVRFNYKDETDGSFEVKSITKANTSDINVPQIGVRFISKSLTQSTKYIREYSFDTDPEKILESIDILPRDGVLNDDNTLSKSTGGAQNYQVLIFGMCASTTKTYFKASVEEQIKEFSGEITNSSKTKMSKIAEKINQLISYGVELAEISGAEEFMEKYSQFPEVSAVNAYSDLKNTQIKVVFNTDVTVSKEQLLLNKGDEAVNFGFVYENKIAILTIKNDFNYKSEYTITVKKDVMSKANESLNLMNDYVKTITVPDILSVSDFSAIREDNTLYISAKLNNNLLEGPQNYALTVAVYNSKGQMIASDVFTGEVEKGSYSGVSTDFTFDDLSETEVLTAKIYVLNSFDEMTRIYKAESSVFN